MSQSIPPADEVKSCCAGFYSSSWARLLLGDSFHPGGLALTERLGYLLGLQPGDRVLDVASGKGSTSIFLAQRFGCEVVGIEYSVGLVAEAIQRAAVLGLAGRVRFEEGDAERLPFVDASFDALICECAFCTFPDKRSAAAEYARVLRPGGRIGLADSTRSGYLPGELETLLAWVACLGDARPIGEYAFLLREAGFAVPMVESHDEALCDLVRDIRSKLLGAEFLAKIGKLALAIGDIDQAKAMAKAAAMAVDRGELGYSLLTAVSISDDTLSQR
ncbi:MAG: methyltransferase domain-containing protein [Chloroflexi bacterium]|nr:methyltransferase domain-containing protein [Chloroflexota bacterium]